MRRFGLALAGLLLGTRWAAAEVVTGTIAKFADGVGNHPGGAFNGSVVSGAADTRNNSFESFRQKYNKNTHFWHQQQGRSGLSTAYWRAKAARQAASLSANPTACAGLVDGSRT